MLSKCLATITVACGIGTFLSSCAIQHQQDEWITLFNGENLEGWEVKIHRHDVGVNFGNTFRVIDNELTVSYDQYEDFNDQFAHLYYKTPFSNFHLTLDYRFYGDFMKDAPYFAELNSGVMFHSQSPYSMPKQQNWPISVEMQFLADLNDGSNRTTGNMCSPGTDVTFDGKTFPGHCLNSTMPALAADKWVSVELIVQNGQITQMVEGQVVLEYSNPVIGGAHKAVKRYDPAQWIEGKSLKEGYIALQSEGHPIAFRNIKIKRLE